MAFTGLRFFLAAVPLLWGAFLTAREMQERVDANRPYEKIVCAHDYLVRERLVLSDDEMEKVKPWQIPWELYDKPQVANSVGRYDKNWRIKLKQIGCSDLEDDTLSYDVARSPPTWGEQTTLPWASIVLTLALSFGLYLLIRAIGWVIGGFAAS